MVSVGIIFVRSNIKYIKLLKKEFFCVQTLLPSRLLGFYYSFFMRQTVHIVASIDGMREHFKSMKNKMKMKLQCWEMF